MLLESSLVRYDSIPLDESFLEFFFLPRVILWVLFFIDPEFEDM